MLKIVLNAFAGLRTRMRAESGIAMAEVMMATAMLATLATITTYSVYQLFRHFIFHAMVIQTYGMRNAVELFRVSHEGFLPGDIPSAYIDWDKTACGGTNGYVGDGDGYTKEYEQVNPADGDPVIEADAAWCHMSKSKLLTMQYSVNTDSSVAARPAVHAPAIVGFRGASLSFATMRTGIDSGTTPVSNYLVVGRAAPRTAATGWGMEGVMTTSEIQLLDRKFDGGMGPNVGQVMGGGKPGACGISGTSSSYDTSINTPNGCLMYVDLGV